MMRGAGRACQAGWRRLLIRRAWWAAQAGWRLLCDMSGETALARRRAACACAKDPIKAAWQATYGGIHRCC